MDSDVFRELVRALIGRARLPSWRYQQELAAARVEARRLLERYPAMTVAQASHYARLMV